ncbi:MAG: DUF2520 domain-containing protein, partial [Peptococcaceae bacterium]|nr:DUF2520 domain-containing protein [Peptococcaceae bacterium]
MSGGIAVRVGIVGAGIVGSTVAIRLWEKGYCVGDVANRSQAKAIWLAEQIQAQVSSPQDVMRNNDLILFGVPDRVIEPLVNELSPYCRKGQVLVHFSGALSSNVMAAAKLYGARLLSLHPLQSFVSVAMALKTLSGAHFAVEGDALDVGLRLVDDLGGIPHCFSKEDKSLYHAAACIASNYLVVLADIAAELLTSVGFKSHEAVQALLPLMQGTVANLTNVGLPDALTGPIARGDYLVVEGHLATLP